MITLNKKPTQPTCNWTQEQQEIISSTETAIMVQALAGTGKSSTLMGIAHKYDNGLYLAFNKNIVSEILPKLPDNWSCATFNSFGLRMVRKHFKKFSVNFKKYNKPGDRRDASQLAQRHMAMDGTDILSSWKKTCDRFAIDYDHIDDAKDILEEGKAITDIISGDDMLQYPIDMGWKSDPYDIILVDEVQDMSPQQVTFLQCIPAKRIVFVGDAYQQIYGFRGSDPEVFKRINEIYRPKTYGMTQSFRCPMPVLDQVTDHVPSIWSTITKGSSTLAIDMQIRDYPDDCFILSRVNSELIQLANRFIKEDIPFSIGGKFIVQIKREVNNAIYKCTTINQAREQAMGRYEEAMKKAIENKWSVNRVNNQFKTILTILNHKNTIIAVERFLKELVLHSESASKRRLMTIHSAKGLENNDIYFLKPSICNEFANEANTEWERNQEYNLKYVAMTRSLLNLTVIE